MTPGTVRKQRTLSYDSLDLKEKVGRSKERSSGSKQKIKLTSKYNYVEEFGAKSKKYKNARVSVHLGGKTMIKKISKEVKQALQ